MTIETELELREILRTIGYSNKEVNEIISWYVVDKDFN